MRNETTIIGRLKLPPGFKLEEDADIVHLCYRGEQIATFSARPFDWEASRKAIEATAEAYISVSSVQSR